MGPQWADEDQNGHPDAQIGSMGIESSRIMEMGQRLSQGPRPSILWGVDSPSASKVDTAKGFAAQRSCTRGREVLQQSGRAWRHQMLGWT